MENYFQLTATNRNWLDQVTRSLRHGKMRSAKTTSALRWWKPSKSWRPPKIKSQLWPRQTAGISKKERSKKSTFWRNPAPPSMSSSSAVFGWRKNLQSEMSFKIDFSNSSRILFSLQNTKNFFGQNLDLALGSPAPGRRPKATSTCPRIVTATQPYKVEEQLWKHFAYKSQNIPRPKFWICIRLRSEVLHLRLAPELAETKMPSAQQRHNRQPPTTLPPHRMRTMPRVEESLAWNTN